MKRKDYTFEAGDGKILAMSRWSADQSKSLKGVIQIIHGKAEHRKRYDDFATFLTTQGFTVFADDHRGCGETISSHDEKGSLPADNGWNRVVKDLIEIKNEILKEFPDQPFFVIGHSLGSIYARNLIMENSNGISGIILSATFFDPWLLRHIAQIMVKIEKWKIGPHTPSPMMENLTSSGYNKPFRPGRTAFDWISRDEKIVDSYIEDPYCGYACSPSFYAESIKGLRIVCDRKRVNLLPRELPIYIISGSLDTVGEFTKGALKTSKQFEKGGIRDLTVQFYNEARHDILKEINKGEVYSDIVNWIEAHL